MLRPAQYPNTYFKQLLDALSITASTIPFVVVALGFLVRQGTLDSRFYAGDSLYILISLGFVLSALANAYFGFVRNGPTPGQYLFLSISYHVLAMFFLLFVAGVNSPFTVGWLILLMATDTYFGVRATILSLATLLLTLAASFVLHPFLSPSEQVTSVCFVLFIAITGAVVSRLRSINDRERIDLERTRDKAGFQRGRLLALVNSMGDAVITTDEDGKIRIYNAATLSLLDTNTDLAGKNIDNVIKFRDTKGRRLRIIEEAAKKRQVTTRTDLMRKFPDGEEQHLYINIAPVQPSYRTRGERGFIFVLRDITKEKSLEQERDEFISVVSHELRTPIAIAEGNLSNVKILQQQNADKAQLLHAVEESHEQIMYLAKLVNDLSTLSRAERGIGTETEQVNVTTMLHEFYTAYQPRTVAKKIRLDLDLDPQLPTITTSTLYLQEILQNLLTNAIKYTEQGSITIQAKVQGRNVIISVKDTGIGIGRADQAHIFEKFYRSEDYRTRETSGTGLGLYVCKKLAEKLGYSLDFESRLNHGSTFALTIPLKSTPTAAPQ